MKKYINLEICDWEYVYQKSLASKMIEACNIYNETHKTNPKNELHSITQYTNKVKKQDYISLAFTWDKTNHGFHFWNKINKKWNDTLNVQHSTDIFELINYVKSLNL